MDNNFEDMGCKRRRLDCKWRGQDCLEINEILRNIFKTLSSTDCVNLSRVNKVWNYEARSALLDRGSLTAKMNTDDGRCKDLRAFALDLQRMREVRKVVPFSGLTMTVSGAEEQHGDWCNASSTEEMDQVYEDILFQMEWKHLALHLTHHWNRKENCAGFQLVKTILYNCACILEEFSLNIESNRGAFYQHFLQDCNFSCLTTLKFQRECRGGDEYLIKSLVARAPNLKVLYTKGPVNLNANLLEGSSAEHVHDHPFSLPRDALNIPESILGQLRLQQIKLGTFDEDFTMERFNVMAPMYLQKSRTTLSSMEVEAELLVLLMDYGICLENVRALTVAMFGINSPRLRLWRRMKSLDFTRIFPNLCSVQIDCDNFPYFPDAWFTVMDVVEEGNAALIEPVNRSGNIKELFLNWHEEIPDSFTRFLVKMFPHIEKLVIEARDHSSVGFWDYWMDLKELDITVRGPVTHIVENLDCAFCGIFLQEVMELRKRDEEYLQKVNIVPVKPSLSCLKRLTTFTFYVDEGVLFHFGPSSLISKVSGLVAFKRRPDLTVTLATNSDCLKRELQHMEPYAPVRLTDRR